MVRTFATSRILTLLPVLAAVLAFSWMLIPVAAQAQTCPVQIVDKGIDCSGGGPTWSYCGTYPSGQCMVEPTCPGWQGAPAAKTRLNCPTCACACPRDTAYSPVVDQLDCTGTADSNCQARDLDCRDVYNRNFACAANAQISGGNCGSCIAGHVSCGGSEICELINPPTWCQAPDVWDECNDTCTFKYVLANPTVGQAPQLATPSLAGNLQITRTGPTADDGYLYLPNGGRIRVDNPGVTELNVGNYDAAATGFKFNLFGGLYSPEGISLIPGDDSVYPGEDGTLEAQQVCLGDEAACRKTWPVGLPEGILPDNVTLRYENSVSSWLYSDFLRNDNRSLAIGVPTGQTAGWLIDTRSDDALPVVNLNDRVGNLWTGMRLARILGGDANKERWFLGMDDLSPNLNVQYDGDINNRFLTVTPAGFIGMSQEVPADKLHVFGGNLRLEGEGADDATIKLTGENLNTRAWQLGFDGDTGDFRMSRNLSNLDDPTLTAQFANSRVGINHDDPAYPLDVWSEAGTAMMRLVQDTDISLWTGIQLAHYTTADVSPVEKWYIGMPDTAGGGDKFLIRRNGATNDLTIDTNGWVGIGDTTPEAQLAVEGAQAGFRVQNTGVGNDPFMTLIDETFNGYALTIDSGDSGKFKIQTGTPNPLLSPIDRLVIDGAGRIGLNESSPVANLDVSNTTAGTFTIARLSQNFAGTESMGWQLDRQGALKWFVGMNDADESFRVTQGGSPDVDRLVISNSGNVGIGIDPSPQYLLDVDGGRIRAASMRLTSDVDGAAPSGGGQSILGAKNAIGDLVWVEKPVGLPTSGLVDGQTLHYSGGAGVWVPTVNLFNNGERVGINETAPGFPLDIAPAGASTDLPLIRVHGPSSGRRWTGLRLDRAKDNEQWLIGMGDADEDLIVRRAGTDNPITVKADSGNVGVGVSDPSSLFEVAGLVRFNDTDETTSIGRNAGGTGGNLDTENTAVGHLALSTLANAGATNNTAVGYLAGQEITDGDWNTVVGSQAGDNISTGSENTVIGALAGTDMQTSSLSTLVGLSAGQGVTGSSNTALGHSALKFFLVGSNNTAVGRAALQGQISSPFASGSNNSALGMSALGLVSSGSGNSALGYQAGNNITSGSNNVFLGSGADATNGGLNNAIAIGYNAVVSASDSMVLGSGVNVGIGTSTPSTMLEVARDTGGVIGISTAGLAGTAAGPRRPSLRFLGANGGELGRIESHDQSDTNEASRLDLFVRDIGDAATVQLMSLDGAVDSGRVGIKKPDPTSTLDVGGMITTNGLKLVTGAADGLVMKSNAAGEAYWGVVEYATDCTGGKFSHLSQTDAGGSPVVTGGIAATYDGDQGGYTGMNTLCGFDVVSGAAYHICTSEDILRTIRCAPGVLAPISGQRAWISAGPPGYTSPAVNDCNGWTDSDSSASKAYGTYWEFNALTGGAGFGTDCKNAQRVACCSPL